MSARGLPFLFALVAAATWISAARADPPAFRAGVTCAPIIAPARIVCLIDAVVASDKLVWADALVVRAPAFARPLRTRVVLQTVADASGRGGTASAKLALVGVAAGTGELEISVRAVICREMVAGERCAPVLERVSASLAASSRPPK